MCKCPLELEKRKKSLKKQSKGFLHFMQRLWLEGFWDRKHPGLVRVHFCIAGVLGGCPGQRLGNGVGAQHRALVGLERELLGQNPVLQQAGVAFGLSGRKLSDAEDELQAAQLDVAAVVQQGCALPACPTAPDQARAAGFAIAGSALWPLGLGTHHGCLLTWLFILFLVSAAPDDILHFGNNTAWGGWRGLLREVT